LFSCKRVSIDEAETKKMQIPGVCVCEFRGWDWFLYDMHKEARTILTRSSIKRVSKIKRKHKTNNLYNEDFEKRENLVGKHYFCMGLTQKKELRFEA